MSTVTQQPGQRPPGPAADPPFMSQAPPPPLSSNPPLRHPQPVRAPPGEGASPVEHMDAALEAEQRKASPQPDARQPAGQPTAATAAHVPVQPQGTEHQAPAAVDPIVQHVEEEEELFCVCQKPDNEGRVMVGCDGGCDNWFHPECIDATLDEMEKVDSYICPKCAPARPVERQSFETQLRMLRARAKALEAQANAQLKVPEQPSQSELVQKQDGPPSPPAEEPSKQNGELESRKRSRSPQPETKSADPKEVGAQEPELKKARTELEHDDAHTHGATSADAPTASQRTLRTIPGV